MKYLIALFRSKILNYFSFDRLHTVKSRFLTPLTHAGFVRLLKKGIFGPYVLVTFRQKGDFLISNAHYYSWLYCMLWAKELVTKRFLWFHFNDRRTRELAIKKGNLPKLRGLMHLCKRLSCNLWENFYGGRPQPKLSI